MALEAVVFPHINNDLYTFIGANYGHCQYRDNDAAVDDHGGGDLYGNIWSPELFSDQGFQPDHDSTAMSTAEQPANVRPKRRRPKSRKNQEDVENQRMTHIAVERNRRKQMNEYLSVLRSLMPESYVQRGDQASIIGGAINFVKELEHHLQFVSGHKETRENSTDGGAGGCSSFCPFRDFFAFPQYSSSGGQQCLWASSVEERPRAVDVESGIGDIEVTMVESHANLKIRLKRRPAMLSKVAAGLGGLRLTILHLNLTTVDQTVLCSICLKVEDDCKLTSVDDLATAVYHLLGRI